MPPGFHWVLVLVVGFVTCGLFLLVWAFILAGFAKKIDVNSKATMYLIVDILCSVGGTIMSFAGAASNETSISVLGGLLSLVGLVFFILACLNMRTSMVHYYNNVEPYGLSLSSGMMFVFPFAINLLYLQYHFSKIAQWKKTGIKS